MVSTSHAVPFRSPNSSAIHLAISIAPALSANEKVEVMMTQGRFSKFEASWKLIAAITAAWRACQAIRGSIVLNALTHMAPRVSANLQSSQGPVKPIIKCKHLNCLPTVPTMVWREVRAEWDRREGQWLGQSGAGEKDGVPSSMKMASSLLT